MNANQLQYLKIGIAVSTLSAAFTWVARSQDSPQSTVPPFTYEVVETSFPPAGAPIVNRRTLATRSDGSSVSVSSTKSPDGRSYVLRMIEDVSTLRRILINEGAQTTTTISIPNARAAQVRRGPHPTCGQPDTARKATMLGYDVIVHVDDSFGGIGADAYQYERWLTPTLGCIAMQITLRKDGVVKSVQKVENIRIGEPDPALFRIPAGFVEASPSEVARRLQEKVGGRPFNSAGAAESAFERAYMERGISKPAGN